MASTSPDCNFIFKVLSTRCSYAEAWEDKKQGNLKNQRNMRARYVEAMLQFLWLFFFCISEEMATTVSFDKIVCTDYK